MHNISKYAGLGDIALVRWATMNFFSMNFFMSQVQTTLTSWTLTDRRHCSFVFFCGGHLNDNVEMLMPSMLKEQIFSILTVF